MNIFSANTIKEIDRQTIDIEGIKSIDLMERAASAFVEAAEKMLSPHERIFIFAGSGNNGGDAFAIARMLSEQGFDTKLFFVDANTHCSPDCEKNKERFLQKFPKRFFCIRNAEELPVFDCDTIIDGIFGSGLNRPVGGLYKQCIQAINRSQKRVLAIDIPSGLPADGINFGNDTAIKATETYTFQFPKLAFLLPENEQYVSRFEIVDIGLKPEQIGSDLYYTNINDIRPLIRQRSPFSHKGTFGHALFVGGSKGKSGAAILAAKAVLRTGAGLLTVLTAKSVAQHFPTALPEAMTLVQGNNFISKIPVNDNYTAVGIGCGLGTKYRTKRALRKWLSKQTKGVVLDADALNLLSKTRNGTALIPKNSIITPHLKEFDRLVGSSQNNIERLQKALTLAKKNTIFVVLKGHFTAVVTPKGKIHFNTSGNAGMATAGSGDVLTGIILGLLAQKYDAETAAIVGVFLHGLAADTAIETTSEEALLASDIINGIGKAYLRIKNIGK